MQSQSIEINRHFHKTASLNATYLVHNIRQAMRHLRDVQKAANISGIVYAFAKSVKFCSATGRYNGGARYAFKLNGHHHQKKLYKLYRTMAIVVEVLSNLMRTDSIC